jgi:hypothetical protein
MAKIHMNLKQDVQDWTHQVRYETLILLRMVIPTTSEGVERVSGIRTPFACREDHSLRSA